ncbi:MAG: M20/M25/M40 family metallo-hydrolase [Oscillospiraceae bacterium]|nr:M20/M25/M40 family metallo-hydrolase [Oscillospiraceae bacterium]
MQFNETLKELILARSVSGSEGEIAALIRKLAAPMADEIQMDVMGNLIAHRRGPGRRMMVMAHMDSIGFIATYISPEGMIRVGAVGGVSPAQVLYQPVVFQNGVKGIVCKDGKASWEKLSVGDLYLDIGAENREEAMKMVEIGDTATFLASLFPAGGRVVAPYLDDRIGCLVLLMAMNQMGKSDNDIYFVFSTQEEVGLRGAKTAAWAIEPEYALAVDVTPAKEPGNAEKAKGSTVLGGGAAIKVMDKSIICHPSMVSLLKDLARERNIPVQMDVLKSGGTDAGSIHVSRGGVITGGISVPIRYAHTPSEMGDMWDVTAAVDLLIACLEHPFSAANLK